SGEACRRPDFLPSHRGPARRSRSRNRRSDQRQLRSSSLSRFARSRLLLPGRFNTHVVVETKGWADLLQGEEVAYVSSEAAREAKLAPLPDQLHPRVREALAAQGIEELYTHQRAAWDAAARGEHVVVTTGTASGKTLAYRGVFGSHVANVLRRLRRLAAIYGAEPQFLLASATIANPGELVDRLLGVRATVVGDDGAPRAERTIVLWNPPLTDEELGL